MTFMRHMVLKSQDKDSFLSTAAACCPDDSLACAPRNEEIFEFPFSSKTLHKQIAVCACCSRLLHFSLQMYLSAQIDRCLFRGTVHADADVFLFSGRI